MHEIRSASSTIHFLPAQRLLTWIGCPVKWRYSARATSIPLDPTNNRKVAPSLGFASRSLYDESRASYLYPISRIPLYPTAFTRALVADSIAGFGHQSPCKGRRVQGDP